jgi:hypothetical protein
VGIEVVLCGCARAGGEREAEEEEVSGARLRRRLARPAPKKEKRTTTPFSISFPAFSNKISCRF